MAEAVSEWRALAVSEIDEMTLLPGRLGKDGARPHLPTRTLKMPFDNPGEVAIVSWRWDGDLHTRGSRNIASVIHCAKQRRIRYVFIDTVSIDQSLPPNDLIKVVTAFSVLYTKITVLAAYDMVGSDCLDLRYTVLRPWILHEMRLFRYNPGRIIYVGHLNQGTHSGQYITQGILPVRNSNTRPRFETLLEEAWFASFVDSTLGVLLNVVGMTTVADFKYILPVLSHVLSIAQQQMERNDYLLTAAILCRVHGGSSLIVGGQDVERPIPNLHYGRYRFDRVSKDGSASWTFYEIFLDDALVATWDHKYNDYQEYHRVVFRTVLDTERKIFAALGLSESIYESYIEYEEERRAYLGILRSTEIPVPIVEVEEVNFPGFYNDPTNR